MLVHFYCVDIFIFKMIMLLDHESIDDKINNNIIVKVKGYKDVCSIFTQKLLNELKLNFTVTHLINLIYIYILYNLAVIQQ